MLRTSEWKHCRILFKTSLFSLFLLSLLSLSCSKAVSSKLDDYPVCSAKAEDTDRDGWGWENNRSCRLAPYCSSSAVDPDGDGWGWEKQRSCRVAPICSSSAVDPDGDGWGWENGASCAVASRGQDSSAPNQSGNSKSIKFSTTYYPFRNEHYFQTVCGDASAYEGLYFAVTEHSPLWNKSCNNDSWGDCSNDDCLGKWDRMPEDVKRIVNGQKKVREPQCDIPCGKAFQVHSEDRKISSRAVIYDACPAQHWNNRFKEVTEGTNPCAAGSLHLDLRKPLYLKLNNGQENGNIKVWVDVP